MNNSDREAIRRELLRDRAPELLAALLEMVYTHNGPAGGSQRLAREFARKVLDDVSGVYP